jgi:hypothetical protein
LQDGVATAQEDFADPNLFVPKPLNEFGSQPGVSSLPTSTLTTTDITTTDITTTDITTTGNKVSPKKTDTTSSTDRPRPLKKITDNVSSSLSKLAGGLQKQKTAASENNDQ